MLFEINNNIRQRDGGLQYEIFDITNQYLISYFM